MWKISVTKDYYYFYYDKMRRTDTIKKIQMEPVKECQIRLINKCCDEEFFNIIRNEFFIHLLQNMLDTITVIITRHKKLTKSYKLKVYIKDRFKYTKINEYILKL